MREFTGIDGCRAGWLSVTLRSHDDWTIQTYATIGEAWAELSNVELILIDVPIGLVDAGAQQRKCDAEARKLLKSPRASSVFTPPSRPALAYGSREEASEANFKLTGRKIGVQSWGIAPKIREVDEFLRAESDARHKIREAHPELVFWALNDRKAMKHKKSRQVGYDERLRVLSRAFPRAEAVVNEALSSFARKDVARDDVVDALALAITGLAGDVQTIPATPELDNAGLAMEMVYFMPS